MKAAPAPSPRPSPKPSSEQRLVDHYTQDDLLLANATVEIWADARSLIPYDRGMELVERIGEDRHLTTIVSRDGETVVTTSGHRYTTRGVKIAESKLDTEHRSLTSPWYLLTDKSLGAKRGAGS